MKGQALDGDSRAGIPLKEESLECSWGGGCGLREEGVQPAGL